MNIAHTPSPWDKRLVVLYGVSALAGMAVGLYNPLVSVLMKEGGFSEVAIGATTSLFFLFVILTAPLASHIARCFSMRAALGAGLAIAGLVSSLFPYADTLTQWSVLRAALGVGIGLYMIGGQSAVNTFAAESQRTYVVGLHALAFGIGMGLGPLIGAWLYMTDPKLAFFFCGGILILGVPALLAWIPSEVSQKTTRLDRRQIKTISISLHAVFAYGIAEATLLSLFPVFMLERGYSVTTMSLALSGFVMGGIISTLPLSKLADRVGQERVLAYCAVFGIVGSILLAWSPNATLAFTASCLAGASFGPVFALAMAIVGRQLSREDLPSGSALFTIAFSLGAMFAPWLVALIMRNFGSVHIFTLTSLLFGTLLFRLRFKRQAI